RSRRPTSRISERSSGALARGMRNEGPAVPGIDLSCFDQNKSHFAIHCQEVIVARPNHKPVSERCRWSDQSTPSSLLRLFEKSQVRRLLALLGGHQQTLGAEEIVFLANEDLRIVLDANRFRPLRQWIAIANVSLVDSPRPRQRVVDHREFVVQEVRI